MKILFVLEHFHPYLGGVEFLFLQLAKSLVDHGHKVEVITTKFSDELNSTDDFDGIMIHRVDCKNRFLFTFKSLPKILSASKDADIIHTTTYTAALPAFIAGKFKGKKTIVTFHEYWGELWQRLPFLNTMERSLYRLFEYIVSRLRFDRIVAVSDFTAQALIASGVESSRVQQIYNGLDYDAIDRVKQEILESEDYQPRPKEFMFVGRLGVSKGINFIIPAVDKALGEDPTATFKMVIPKVPADLYIKIQSDLDQMKCKDRVRILHNLSKLDLYREILSAAFMLIPSYSEGFCFVAAETEALSIPIVSSNQGALKEVVGAKHINLSELSVIGLYEAIMLGLEGKWSVKDSTKFTLEKSVEDYISLYKELLNAE